MKVFSSALAAYAGALAVGLAVEAAQIPVVEGDPDSFYSVLRRVQVYMDAYAPFDSFEYGVAASNGVYIVTHWDTSAVPPPQLLDGVNTFPSLEIAEADPDEVAVSALGNNRRSWKLKPHAARKQIKKIKRLDMQEAKPAERKAAEREFLSLAAEIQQATGATNPIVTFEAALDALDSVEDPAVSGRLTRALMRIDKRLSRYARDWDAALYMLPEGG